MTCQDLRIGGTLSSAGISGGVSINDTAIYVTDWTGIFGNPGLTGSLQEVNGRPGGYVAGDLLGRSRNLLLNMGFTRWGPSNYTLTEPDENAQLWENTDDFLQYLANPSGFYLEYELQDGSERFTKAYALDAAQIAQARRRRTTSVPLATDWPYWKAGGNESSQTINGVDTMSIGGRVTLYSPVLVFSGDGTFTHDDEGWSIEVTGSGGAVTVDLGNRTVTEGGSPASNRIRRSHRKWGWFPIGTNNVTTDVSVDVTWRPEYV